MSKPVILTGLRANSEFHIGNYLGAILPMVEMQKKHANDYQLNMFIPDLHSFTTPIDHGKLYKNTIDNLKMFMASGLDIDNPSTFIYRQSYIPAHSELAWILDCFTYFGEASRMIEFKDKSLKLGNETVSIGQFNYPVLMAADILLYGAKYVPLGDDQQQHLELARDLAIRINNKFKANIFTVPEDWAKQLEFANRERGVRIRSLRHPSKKMSKSVDDPSGTILMSDDPEAVAKKILGAETDSLGVIDYTFNRQPGISNLIQISALLANKPMKDVALEWKGKSSYGELKNYVAGQMKTFLTDFQANLAKIDESKLLKKLDRDEAAMRKVADRTLLKVQQAVGLRPE